MKKTILILGVIILFFSCQKDGFISINSQRDNCDFNTEVVAPSDFEIALIGTIEINGGLNEIQFIDDNIGYILGHNNFGGHAEVFKTIDGGENWIDLSLSIRKNPINMYFLNEEIGFISHYGSNGNLLKTSDKGLSWTELEYENLKGNIYHIQSDNNNNLYGLLSGLETETVLIKSIDEGDSWQIINDLDRLNFSLLTFSFKVFEDNIFISGKDGVIFKTDLDGNNIFEIQTDLVNIWDFEIIDKDNFVIASSNKTIKSIDGGDNWIEIYDRSARVIDFLSSEEGIMLLNKSYCPTDVYQSNDVIAYTKDGGLTWNEGDEVTNLNIKYSDTDTRSSVKDILIIEENIYELRKQ